VAYIIYNHSLQVLTAFEMNTLFNLAPIWTAIMSWFLLGEHLTVFQICGMLVVIGGVMLVQRRPYESEARRLEETLATGMLVEAIRGSGGAPSGRTYGRRSFTLKGSRVRCAALRSG
jgi:hypothetical protein